MTSLPPIIALVLSLSVLVSGQGPARFTVVALFAKTSLRAEPDSRVFLGPQDAFHITWLLSNRSHDTVIVPPPSEVLNIFLTTGAGLSIPVKIEWESVMGRGGPNTSLPFEVPLGQTELAEQEIVKAYAIVRRTDGRFFPPGEYQMMFDISRVGPALSTAGATSWLGQTTGGGIVSVKIDPIDSPSSALEYHRTEAAFYIGQDPEQVLEHRLRAVELPDASIGDRMALGKAYAELGRHPEATRIYSPLLSELIADARAGGIIRDGRHLRIIASSYIAVSDLTTARQLLEADGLTASEISESIKRLRAQPNQQRIPWYER